MNRWLCLTGIALLLDGCATTPTTYLTLAPTTGPTVSIASPPLAVAKVMMPAAIDRLYLTSATGPTTLHVADHARWAAPLGGEAQNTLADDLAQRLPGTTVLHPGDPAPPGGARLIAVNVTRFLPDPSHVVLNADWRVTARDHHRVLATGRDHIVIPSAATPAARASAMSAALGRLADRIIARLDR
ncbi:PqiC family protein [Acidiphilium sp. PA]|uniref:PqiC family protein n=1 Tax=Acidiphilium sp. PA TaxID=2871705 RepID=UPI002244A378|nr:PqiC family protein [Acidiphilium sp. PA]MCW8305564.1 PqiC family protein [Acidiphilium sp. PA]